MTAQINLLLVEDNPDDVVLMEAHLYEEKNYRLTVANDLSSALQLSEKTQFDMVLVDLSLPDSSGLNTFTRLKGAFPSSAIVVLSGLEDEELAVKTVHEGAQDYLVKRFINRHLLVRSIRYALERRKARVQLARYTEELRQKNTQIERDLLMAREIQHAFLPLAIERFPESASNDTNHLDFEFWYQPATSLGGDFFDVFPISETKCAILLCDVMGHGVQPSLVAAFLLGAVQKLKFIAEEPNAVVGQLNQELSRIFDQSGIPMFASAFYAVIDTRNGHLEYTNAGHPNPFLIRSTERKEALIELSHEWPQPALGIETKVEYSSQNAPLDDRDYMLLYTDGAYENFETDGDSIGMDLFRNAVLSLKNCPSDRFLGTLVDELFGKSEIQEEDDVCLIKVGFVKSKVLELNRMNPEISSYRK